jgi:hypothetical protein
MEQSRGIVRYWVGAELRTCGVMGLLLWESCVVTVVLRISATASTVDKCRDSVTATHPPDNKTFHYKPQRYD